MTIKSRLQIWSIGLSAIVIFMVTFAATAVARAAIDPGYNWFYNFHSGLCVSVPGSSTTSGKQLWQDPCVNDKNFGWDPITGFDGTQYVIRNDNSKMCMAVQNDSTTSGAPIVQQGCSNLSNPATDERFVITQAGFYNGYGWAVYESNHSGYCITISGGSEANGAYLVQGSCGSRSSWFVFVAPGTSMPCPCTSAVNAHSAPESPVPPMRREK